MKVFVWAVFTAGLMILISAQQCKYVSVCDDDIINPRTRSKGQKGNPGVPGKAGPKSKGDKGDLGGKGERGEACDLGTFDSDIRKRLTELETQLRPATCTASSSYGRQILRSGEEAFCDSGWTVFQRRFDGSIPFNLNWADYKVGFGNMTYGEFWLGLDKLHQLTNYRGCKLRVDLWNFENNHTFAEYSSFSVKDESDNYRLHIYGYSGTAGDGMSGHNNMQFTTNDRDNDLGSDQCAFRHNPEGAAWWFNSCFRSTLNAPWGRSTSPWSKMIWYDWEGKNKPVKASTMKLRCD